ncbi:hypothetical protein PsorP6_001071 [Peronosclerospora sorghi]|uniref:Uncharacterized protein n=1 Tax=Peronosclerospora sorghi TaxID=230839 RepID=A0ACC0WWG9_9STRA|nr:hypothetical protein PsorP6_001071 [Peronosclerospora sorghi]
MDALYGLRENVRPTIVVETGDGVLHTSVHAGDAASDGNRRNEPDPDRRENPPIRITVRFQQSNNISDAESEHSTQSLIRRSREELERRDDQVNIFDEEEHADSPPVDCAPEEGKYSFTHRDITSTLTEPLDSEKDIILTQGHPDDLILQHILVTIIAFRHTQAKKA